MVKNSLNFRAHHLLFRDSQVFLNPSESFIGYRALEMTGLTGWSFRTLSRPFLRVNCRPDPDLEQSAPDHYVQGGSGVTLTTSFHSPDVLRFEFDCAEPRELFVGPACDFKNFGGVLEQEFLICWGHGDNQSATEHGIRLHHEDVTGILATGALEAEVTHSGVKLTLPTGRCVLALAVGPADDEAALGPRAEAALTEVRDSANEAFWDERITKLPAASPAETGKAIEAIWAIESSNNGPSGVLTGSCLSSCVTALWRHMFLWDTCFSVLGYRSINPELCQEWLQNFIDLKRPGTLPISACISNEGGGDETQVPIFSWAAHALYQKTGDRDFLAAAFRTGLENNDWWLSQADSSCGGLPMTKAISYDNSPIYDRCRIDNVMMNTAPTVNPDIVAALVVDCEELTAMALALGDESAAADLRERRRFLAEKGHECLYDADREYYYSHLNGEPIYVKVGPALNSIVFAPEAVAKALADRYVRPGSPAWPVHGVATVLADEPSYEPQNYWRGMIWGSTNRLLVDALDRRGLTSHADLLAQETIDLFVNNSSFFEVISPETGRGQRGTHYNGFGTGVYLDLLERASRDPAA